MLIGASTTGSLELHPASHGTASVGRSKSEADDHPAGQLGWLVNRYVHLGLSHPPTVPHPSGMLPHTR